MQEDCLLARVLERTGALLFGEFTLSSGRKSNVYVDLRRTLSDPVASRIILAYLAVEAAPYMDTIELIAGVATAGVPWAAMLSAFYGKPLAYVRPEEKQYGTKKLVEGVVNGKRVLVVDDVATTGRSLLNAVNALRRENAIVEYALVFLDREEGAQQLLNEHGVKLLAVTKLRKILDCINQEKQRAKP